MQFRFKYVIYDNVSYRVYKATRKYICSTVNVFVMMRVIYNLNAIMKCVLRTFPYFVILPRYCKWYVSRSDGLLERIQTLRFMAVIVPSGQLEAVTNIRG